MISSGIRRRPTLPGRFQPSTISVLRLNFCVRDGNRWIPQAIVTGNQTEFGCSRCRAFWFRRIGQTTASRLRSSASAALHPRSRARGGFAIPSRTTASAGRGRRLCLRPAPCTLAVPARSCDAALGPWGSRAPSKPHRAEIPSGPTKALCPLL